MAANLLLRKYQYDLSDEVLTDVYECPEKRTNTITIFLCNGDVAAVTFRLAVALAGEADSLKQYIYRATPLPGGNTFKISLTLDQGDIVRVWGSAGSAIVCNVFVDQSRPLARL